LDVTRTALFGSTMPLGTFVVVVTVVVVLVVDDVLDDVVVVGMRDAWA
jgi:hypothetical protein